MITQGSSLSVKDSANPQGCDISSPEGGTMASVEGNPKEAAGDIAPAMTNDGKEALLGELVITILLIPSNLL